MTTDEAIVPVELVEDRRRNAALMRAIGFDKLTEPERELALAIAKKYELDLLLRHAMIIEGHLYISRDGLLWIAHRSGQLDGIEVTEPVIVGKYWHATCRVYRRDMSRPFEYSGRYPVEGKNRAYAPEMAVKVAESMALRRAFNVSAPTVDERWDVDAIKADADAASPQQPPRTLAERVAEKRQAVIAEAVSGPADEDDEVTQAMGVRRMEEAARVTLDDLPDECGDGDSSPMALGFCTQPSGHKGIHRSELGTWPNRPS